MERKLSVLNVGCGKTALKYQSNAFNDWNEIRVDFYDNPTANIKSSILDLKEIEDESVDAVWASHVVEHCYFHELPKVFGSMMRVINKEGFVVVRVPDLGYLADKIKEGLLETLYESPAGPVSPIDMLYGHRPQIERDGEGMAHKTGFTEKSMGQILSSLGINSMVTSCGGEVIALLYKEKIPQKFLNTEGFIL